MSHRIWLEVMKFKKGRQHKSYVTWNNACSMCFETNMVTLQVQY